MSDNQLPVPKAEPVYYEPRQIGILTFVFGPFAGVWLLWRNWKAAGEDERAVKTAIAGVIGTLIITKLADFLPGMIWLIFFVCFAYSSLFAGIAEKWQKSVIEGLKAKGLKRASSWKFCKIGILLFAAYWIVGSLIP